MDKYEVTLSEVISHTLEVRAESEEEAIELAKQLVGNEPDSKLRRKHDYSVDTVGWGGFAEAVLDDAS